MKTQLRQQAPRILETARLEASVLTREILGLIAPALALLVWGLSIGPSCSLTIE
jgi:hypothetical protein